MAMKLSEAIRTGAAIRPQGFYGYFVKQDGQICSCVYGAAVEALTGHPLPDDTLEDSERIEELLAVFPGHRIHQSCPVETCENDTDAFTATHLNDDHKWSREAIADWLEAQGY